MYKRTKPISDMDAYVEERLSDYLDGTLSAKERAKVEDYLSKSATARSSLESMRYTVHLLRQTPPPPLPRQFTLPVTTRAPAVSRGWMVWGLRGVALAATVAFVLLLTVNLLRQNNLGANEAAPSVAVAPPTQIAQNYSLQPTPLATFPAQAQDNSSSAGAPAATAAPQVLMITTTPEAFGQAIPVTETPQASKAQPTQAKSQPRNNTSAAAPTNAPQPTSAPAATEEPTTMAVAAANSAVSNTPVEAPAASTESTDATERSLVQEIPVEGVVTATQLQIRQGPGLQFNSIGGQKKGEQVSVLGRSEDSKWFYVDLTKNHKIGRGWVGAMFVELSQSLDTLPFYDENGELLPPTPLPTATPSETPSEVPSSTQPIATPSAIQDTPTPVTETPASDNSNNTAPTQEAPSATETPVAEPSETPTVQSQAQPTSAASPAAASTKTPKVRPTKQPKPTQSSAE